MRLFEKNRFHGSHASLSLSLSLSHGRRSNYQNGGLQRLAEFWMKEIVYLLQLLEQDVCRYDLHLLTLA